MYRKAVYYLQAGNEASKRITKVDKMSYSKIQLVRGNEIFPKCKLVEDKSIELFGMYDDVKKEFDILVFHLADWEDECAWQTREVYVSEKGKDCFFHVSTGNGTDGYESVESYPVEWDFEDEQFLDALNNEVGLSSNDWGLSEELESERANNEN